MAVRENMTELEMMAENPSAWAKACAMVAHLEHGGLVKDYNLFDCTAHPDNNACGRTIEAANWDEFGPDWVQPEGFKCACGAWVSNECGNRKTRFCNDCEAA